jgi:hypothetical protein
MATVFLSILACAVVAGAGWLAEGLALPWLLIVPAVALLAWPKARRLMATHEFTVVLLTILTLLTMLGTIVLPPSVFARLPVVALLGLIGLASAACLVEKLPKTRRLGYLLVHGSVVVVLVGAGIKHFTKEEAFLHLKIGHPTNRAIAMEGGEQVQRFVDLPFTTRLDDFDVEFYETKPVVYVYRAGQSRPAAVIDAVAGRKARVGDYDVVISDVREEKAPEGVAGTPDAVRRWVDLEVNGQKGRVHLNGSHGNADIRFAYRDKEGEVKVYRSTLSILDDAGDSLVQQEVMVNHPLRHGDWWLYQSNWDPDDPTYSGIHAVRDPGLWPAVIGLVLLVVGAILKIRLPRTESKNGTAGAAAAPGEG